MPTPLTNSSGTGYNHNSPTYAIVEQNFSSFYALYKSVFADYPEVIPRYVPQGYTVLFMLLFNAADHRCFPAPLVGAYLSTAKRRKISG